MGDNDDRDVVLPIIQVPPRLVVNQNEQDDNNDDDDERGLPLLLLKKMSDHAFMQVIWNLPLRTGGTFIANYACRRLNRILGTTARLVPVAYNLHPAMSHISWYITAQSQYNWKREIGVPWAYDPITNGWYKFPLNRSMIRRSWDWEKIASADGLVCAPSRSRYWGEVDCELEIFDPYIQRFRTLPRSPHAGALTQGGEYNLRGHNDFSTNIWITDPETCEYKVIVMRCMHNIARASKHVFVESYDRTLNWQVLKRISYNGLSPGWEMVGTSAICHDTLYSIFRNTSLGEAVGQQLFLHRFCLNSTNTNFIHEELYDPLPGPFYRSPQHGPSSLSPPAVILNCNNNLILVGRKGKKSGDCRSVKVWRFIPHLATWHKLGVMPRRFLHMLSVSRDSGVHRYTGGGNFVYFRNSYGNRLVVLDLSMTDESGLRVREEAWKEASECGIGHVRGRSDKLRYDFCYEPRLRMGVPL